MLDDGVPSISSVDQNDLETKVRALYADFVSTGIADDDERIKLRRKAHATYLRGGLGELPAGRCCGAVAAVNIVRGLRLSSLTHAAPYPTASRL